MKFLLDAVNSFTSITGVLISIVIMICFYIYINRRIHKIETKIDGVLGKTLQMVQEVVNESKHVQCYTQPQNTDQEINREYHEGQNNNEAYDVNNIEEDESDSEEDDEHYEDDDDEDIDSDINENELIDANGGVRETSLHLDESTQMTTDDVIPIFDIKSIHMDDVETQDKDEDLEKELKKKTVSDLRKQIVDMNLKTHEEAKKMKKGDIIKLLNNANSVNNN